MAERKDIMLAYAYTDKLFSRLGSPIIVQPKLEGDRMRAVIKDGKSTLYSSSGAVRTSVPHINAQLDLIKFPDIEFDGEAYVHGMDHSNIRSIVSRTRNLHSLYSSMEYHIYDTVSSSQQFDRLKFLSALMLSFRRTDIKVVPYLIAHNSDEVQKMYKQCLDLEYEGIIMRQLNAPYIRKKTTTMLKLKPRLSEYFRIIDVHEEMDKYGKPKDTFGAFVCTTEDGEKFSVGSGPTKEQRRMLWWYAPLFIGLKVKVRFQDYTQDRKVPKMPVIDKVWLQKEVSDWHNGVE